MTTTYTIEATPSGRGFAYGTEVRTCESWEEAVAGANQCQAAKKAAATTFWAVERGSELNSAARPVIRNQQAREVA